jgi:cobalt/nickel transport system permease protein
MLWAVHLSDDVLRNDWIVGGFAGLAILLFAASRKIREDEIPRVALLTAAFFVSSLIHVRIGPTSVHLLLNGLLGVMLGWRAPMAVAIGLLLQAVLLQHGGFTTLGASTCVISIPALAAGAVFRPLHRLDWRRKPLRYSVVILCCAMWLTCLAFSVAMLAQGPSGGWRQFDVSAGAALLFRPTVWGSIAVLAVVIAVVESRFETAPEFPLGLLLGGIPVLLTVALNCWALVAGGHGFETPAYLLMVAHLPIAALEGVIVGFTLGFLAKAKPELLGLPRMQ